MPIFPSITTAITTEPAVTLATKTALKTKVYMWFTNYQSDIANSIDQRKVILPRSTDMEFITNIMTPEFANCSVYDRTMICKEFFDENGIEVLNLTSSYSNVYVKIRTRDTFVPLTLANTDILDIPNVGLDVSVIDEYNVITDVDVY